METSSAIISVVGTDKVGIISKISSFLSERDVNIVDISQTILDGNFVMMMMVDTTKHSKNLDALKTELKQLGESINVSIDIMHEKVFNAMHRI
ncbi:MAG: ACT domain-containing protein [Spirochaetaceae bacterium]|jgi:ACT domain-containing protein|nr:ACT domain-containing protein [Spirochaetaceae bacterium]